MLSRQRKEKQARIGMAIMVTISFAVSVAMAVLYARGAADPSGTRLPND